MVTYYEDNKKGSGIGMLVSGPILGLMYVIALPFIAIATVVTLVGGKMVAGIVSTISNLVSFGWRPSEAYLSGKKKEEEGEGLNHQSTVLTKYQQGGMDAYIV